MLEIKSNVAGALNRASVCSLNAKISKPITKDTFLSINHVGKVAPKGENPVAMPTIPNERVKFTCPKLLKAVNRGQKIKLPTSEFSDGKLHLSFGWIEKDNDVDMDVSAFLLTSAGKVSDESWFIFYGNDLSSDGAVKLRDDVLPNDRVDFVVDLKKLNSKIEKIVFVLTIYEAFERKQNFSMIRDAYVRVKNNVNQEIVSYRVDESSAVVTSMTVCELYLNKGEWKFNPVGNGVLKDLAGQCEIYGIETN